MDAVCELCGAVGYRHLLVRCNSCKNATRHRGIMKIGQEYISLAAHMSNQAHLKVKELSRSLPPVMKVTKQSKLKAWPKWWEASGPTAGCIGLYFFSDNMRPNEDLDRLLQYVTDHSIVLKYVFGFTKLLIFPSALLPEQCQTFQGKHYLWGVFKSRPGASKADTRVKQKVSTSHATEKEEHQDKVQGSTLDQEIPVLKHTTPSNRQPSPGAVHDIVTETAEKEEHQDKVQGSTLDQEMPVLKHTTPSNRQPSPGAVHDIVTETAEKEEYQDKVQGSTQDQEMPVRKRTTPSKSQPSPGAVHDGGTETDPGDHGKPHDNSEARPTMLLGLVDTQTPRLEQIIKELENEGALVFAVKGLAKPNPVRL